MRSTPYWRSDIKCGAVSQTPLALPTLDQQLDRSETPRLGAGRENVLHGLFPWVVWLVSSDANRMFVLISPIYPNRYIDIYIHIRTQGSYEKELGQHSPPREGQTAHARKQFTRFTLRVGRIITTSQMGTTHSFCRFECAPGCAYQAMSGLGQLGGRSTDNLTMSALTRRAILNNARQHSMLACSRALRGVPNGMTLRL